MYDVYWIRRKDHDDVLSQGYVGVSKDKEKRFRDHFGGRSSPKLTRALQKYGDDIEFDTIATYSTKEGACEMERQLRPDSQIGWNIAPGGGYPPPIKDYPEARERIRQKLIEIGHSPYSEKTHSKDTIAKSNQSKRKLAYRWFHNPASHESRLVPTGVESPPAGWVLGKVPKKKPKERGVDYVCHMMTVDVYCNNELIAKEVSNFKEWCTRNNLRYFAGSRSQSTRVLKEERKIYIKNIDGEVYEDGVNTRLSQKEYSTKINKSQSYVSTGLKAGFYIVRDYDVYRFERKER